MFSRFVAELATNKPVGADAIRTILTTAQVMGLKEKDVVEAFSTAASEHLADRPSVLGKLVFLAERSVAVPSQVAALRGKLPFGEEYVDKLQVRLARRHRGGGGRGVPWRGGSEGRASPLLGDGSRAVARPYSLPPWARRGPALHRSGSSALRLCRARAPLRA